MVAPNKKHQLVSRRKERQPSRGFTLNPKSTPAPKLSPSRPSVKEDGDQRLTAKAGTNGPGQIIAPVEPNDVTVEKHEPEEPVARGRERSSYDGDTAIKLYLR